MKNNFEFNPEHPIMYFTNQKQFQNHSYDWNHSTTSDNNNNENFNNENSNNRYNNYNNIGNNNVSTAQSEEDIQQQDAYGFRKYIQCDQEQIQLRQSDNSYDNGNREEQIKEEKQEQYQQQQQLFNQQNIEGDILSFVMRDDMNNEENQNNEMHDQIDVSDIHDDGNNDMRLTEEYSNYSQTLSRLESQLNELNPFANRSISEFENYSASNSYSIIPYQQDQQKQIKCNLSEMFYPSSSYFNDAILISNNDDSQNLSRQYFDNNQQLVLHNHNEAKKEITKQQAEYPFFQPRNLNQLGNKSRSYYSDFGGNNKIEQILRQYSTQSFQDLNQLQKLVESICSVLKPYFPKFQKLNQELEIPFIMNIINLVRLPIVEYYKSLGKPVIESQSVTSKNNHCMCSLKKQYTTLGSLHNHIKRNHNSTPVWVWAVKVNNKVGPPKKEVCDKPSQKRNKRKYSEKIKAITNEDMNDRLCYAKKKNRSKK